MIQNLPRPSSTITAATLAGMGMSVFWAAWNWLTDMDAPDVLVSSSTTFISALVGYFKVENVLPIQRTDA